MHPILFSFVFFTIPFYIRAYPVFLTLGAAATIYGSFRFMKRSGLLSKQTVFLITILTLSAFAGARLLHILINIHEYLRHPYLMTKFSEEGFSLYGGILSASITGIIIARISGLRLWELGDAITPFLGIGISILRIGCFFNGCCFGNITSLPWGVTFPLFSEAHKYQMLHGQTGLFSVRPVHPTQLYEAAAGIIGCWIALFFIKRKAPAGAASLAAAIWFTAFRWMDYFLMVRPITFDASGYFYPFFYAFLIIVSSVLLIRRLRFPVQYES